VRHSKRSPERGLEGRRSGDTPSGLSLPIPPTRVFSNPAKLGECARCGEEWLGPVSNFVWVTVGDGAEQLICVDCLDELCGGEW
jgi:hypothetical protein